MAPGGFSESVLTEYPESTIDAITLPVEHGGHQVMAQKSNINITYADITMYAAEYGADDIPCDHPDSKLFRKDFPYAGSIYDLIFCGGAVLRKHQRAAYREGREGTRLQTSQLILALQRIKVGGTIVILMHRVDSWDSFCILRTFDKFANLQLFKPHKAHVIKSSFYAILKNVNPMDLEAVKAIGRWKSLWHDATFGACLEQRVAVKVDEEDVGTVLEEFGPQWRKLGKQIWKIQAKALRKSIFLKSAKVDAGNG